jgi:dipeptidyl aminopeptidase/acylaminoacyl peptidase
MLGSHHLRPRALGLVGVLLILAPWIPASGAGVAGAEASLPQRNNFALQINDQHAEVHIPGQPVPAYRPDHAYTFPIDAPGGRLSFGAGDAYLSDNTGRHTTHIGEPGPMVPRAYLPLTAHNAISSQSAGERIAFTSWRGGNADLYVINSDSSGAFGPGGWLTHTPAGEYSPAWSRDGTKLVFECRDGTVIDVCTIDADGGGYRNITKGSRPDLQAIMPVWSPDGRQIAVGRPLTTGGASQIWIMDADGGNQRQVTSGWEPSWSPDGSRIAFVRNDGTAHQIWTVRPDGSDLRKLTSGSHAHSFPRWSPDGQLLAFVLDYAQVAVMDASGGPPRTVVDRRSFGLSWSPEGDRLAIAPEDGLWITNLDGTGLRQITDRGSYPSWTSALGGGEPGP